MKRHAKSATLESVFPSKLGRDAGDKAVDELPLSAPMTEYLDTWEAAYFSVTGKSPFRGGQ